MTLTFLGLVPLMYPMTLPIVGGTRDTGDPAVVLLVEYPDDHSTFWSCTASIVSPTVVLTAAHCVGANGNHSQCNGPCNYGVFLGSDASAYGSVDELLPHLLPVAETHYHPDYSSSYPYYGDIAVAILAAPTSVAPLPLNRSSLSTSVVGDSVRIIGYGQTTPGTWNVTKYQATTMVAGLDGDDTITIGDEEHCSCVGDSGGPALMPMNGHETIVGTVSFGPCPGQGTGEAHYRRVDQHLDFIDTYVDVDQPPPPPDAGVPGDDGGGGDPDAGPGGGGDDDGDDHGGGSDDDGTTSGGCSAAGAGPMPSLALIALPLFWLLTGSSASARARRRHAGGDRPSR